MLTLYHGEPNTFALKPLIALREKGLAFESRFMDRLDPESAAPPRNAEAEFNLDGDGPILMHDDAILSEAFFITLYLDEAFPEVPLRPVDADGRWRVLAWARFVGQTFAPAVVMLGCHRYLAPALRGREDEVRSFLAGFKVKERRVPWEAALNNAYTDGDIAESRRRIDIAIRRIEDALVGTPWLAGNNFSLTDIDVFAMAAGLPKLVPELVNEAAAPRMMEWLDRVRSRPAVKSALAASRTGKPDECFRPGPEHSRWG